MFHSTDPGTYAVKAQVRAKEPSKLTVRIGEGELEAEIQATGSEYSEMILGEIEISESGDLIMSIRPVQEGWMGIELGTVTLVKQ